MWFIFKRWWVDEEMREKELGKMGWLEIVGKLLEMGEWDIREKGLGKRD